MSAPREDRTSRADGDTSGFYPNRTLQIGSAAIDRLRWSKPLAIRSVSAVQIIALKIELERVRFDTVPAGGEEQHHALFLDAADRDSVVVASSEAGILRFFNFTETHALNRHLAAREAVALRHGRPSRS